MYSRRISATLAVSVSVSAAFAGPPSVTNIQGQRYFLEAGHPSLQALKLPMQPPYPADNAPSAARVELGKKLFFDPRLSGDGNMSCSSCHNPSFGWSDGLPTARGAKSQVLGRATPTVFNTAFNSIQMWDGRKKSLEDQALGPMQASVEMNTDLDKLFAFLRGNEGYRKLFEEAYPGQPIDGDTTAKAIASFERTVISSASQFDRWIAGDVRAMTPDQVQGFALFVDPKKGNCASCHSGSNFTDDGFHNIGLASYAKPDADPGRYAHKPLPALKGAFKTPTVREAANTAPYFHDGSAATLMDVVEHYDRGGDVKTNLSKSIHPLGLSVQEKRQLVQFLEALSTPPKSFELPALPR